MSEAGRRTPEELLSEFEGALVPGKPLLRELVRERAAVIPTLLAWLEAVPPEQDEDDPRTPLDLRASWLLLHLRPPEALPVIGRVMVDPARGDLAISISMDLSTYGPPVVPVLVEVLGSESATNEVRGFSAGGLGYLAKAYPVTREPVLAALRAGLEAILPVGRDVGRAGLAGAIATTLLEVGDEESVPRVRLLLEEGQLDIDRVAASEVRQTLRGWRTYSSQSPEKIRFDILEEHDELPWTVADTNEFDLEAGPEEPLAPLRRETQKIGRNAPCPCGSGKKHKRCCGG